MKIDMDELHRALDNAPRTVRPEHIAALIRGLIDGDSTGTMQARAEAWIQAHS